MANSFSNVPLTTFSQGEFMSRLEAYINDPSNVTNPTVALLECLPPPSYTNQDIVNLELALDDIINTSINFESKRIYNNAISIQQQLNTAKCIGVDSVILFEDFINSAIEFTETYYSIPISSYILATDVNQNPNYYNV